MGGRKGVDEVEEGGVEEGYEDLVVGADGEVFDEGVGGEGVD